ncbi:MAG: hypothetical protein Rhims3KO_32010 [Hyphomicrobiales bacterium]
MRATSRCGAGAPQVQNRNCDQQATQLLYICDKKEVAQPNLQSPMVNEGFLASDTFYLAPRMT